MSTAIKQFFIIAAILAIILVFIIQFRPGTNVQTSGGPECVAEVSGHCISDGDYVAAYLLSAPPGVDRDDVKAMKLPRVMVDGLIERWLLNQDAQRLGLSVSDSDINRQLVKGWARISLPVAQQEYFTKRLGLLPEPVGPARTLRVRDPKKKEFDVKRYERTIRDMTKKTPKDFREFQRKEFVAARMRSLIRSRVRVSEHEARSKYDRDRERAAVDYVKVERAYYRKWVIDSSDEAVTAWVKANEGEVDDSWKDRKDSFLPECRAARHILVRVDPAAPDKAEAMKQAKDKLTAARERIDGGESFADVAEELSDDPGSRERGGDLGCVTKGRMVKPFEEALFALEEGKLSKLVETGYGVHLILVDKIAKGEDAEAIGRKQVARELYQKKESERLAAEGAKQILAAVQGGKSFEDAVKAHLEAVLSAKVRKAAEEARGADDDPEDDGDDADDDADASDGDDGDDDDADAPVTALTDPTRPRVQHSLPFTVAGPPFAGVQAPGETARALFALEKPGTIAGDLIKLYDGYAIAQLKERSSPTDEDWQKERAGYIDGMRREKQRDALVRYVRQLRARHEKEITYHRSVFDREGEGEGEGDEEKK